VLTKPERNDVNEQLDFHQLFKYRPNAYHHVTFPTKRRRPVLAGKVRQRVHYWFDEIARQHDFQLLERSTWLDHAHMLIFVRIGENLSDVMHQLKGESARRIFLEFDIVRGLPWPS
jgi:REP element-mobilizing transposase RayT